MRRPFAGRKGRRRLMETSCVIYRLLWIRGTTVGLNWISIGARFIDAVTSTVYLVIIIITSVWSFGVIRLYFVWHTFDKRKTTSEHLIVIFLSEIIINRPGWGGATKVRNELRGMKQKSLRVWLRNIATHLGPTTAAVDNRRKGVKNRDQGLHVHAVPCRRSRSHGVSPWANDRGMGPGRTHTPAPL